MLRHEICCHGTNEDHVVETGDFRTVLSGKSFIHLEGRLFILSGPWAFLFPGFSAPVP
jgi:hypothetical protein